MQGQQKMIKERIESDRIIIDASGKFPKKLLFVEPRGKEKEYELRKTAKGGYLINR